MAAIEQGNNDEVISSINIIPFVDIVLVLLIIFMVTSTAIVRAAIKVELPKAASAGQETAATVNLVLTKDGEFFLDGELKSAEQIAANVRRKATENTELQAVISADTRLSYGQVVSVIDLIKSNGVKTFALNIERDPSSARASETE